MSNFPSVVAATFANRINFLNQEKSANEFKIGIDQKTVSLATQIVSQSAAQGIPKIKDQSEAEIYNAQQAPKLLAGYNNWITPNRENINSEMKQHKIPDAAFDTYSKLRYMEEHSKGGGNGAYEVIASSDLNSIERHHEDIVDPQNYNDVVQNKVQKEYSLEQGGKTVKSFFSDSKMI
jgi:hypothetical protein